MCVSWTCAIVGTSITTPEELLYGSGSAVPVGVRFPCSRSSTYRARTPHTTDPLFCAAWLMSTFVVVFFTFSDLGRVER